MNDVQRPDTSPLHDSMFLTSLALVAEAARRGQVVVPRDPPLVGAAGSRPRLRAILRDGPAEAPARLQAPGECGGEGGESVRGAKTRARSESRGRGAKVEDEAGCEERSDEALRILRLLGSFPSRIVAPLLFATNSTATRFARRQHRSLTSQPSPTSSRLPSLVAAIEATDEGRA